MPASLYKTLDNFWEKPASTGIDTGQLGKNARAMKGGGVVGEATWSSLHYAHLPAASALLLPSPLSPFYTLTHFHYSHTSISSLTVAPSTIWHLHHKHRKVNGTSGTRQMQTFHGTLYAQSRLSRQSVARRGYSKPHRRKTS